MSSAETPAQPQPEKDGSHILSQATWDRVVAAREELLRRDR